MPLTLGRGMSPVSGAPVPQIDYDFLTMTSLPPEMALSRSSTALYFDSNGDLAEVAADTPRFQHVFATGVREGLLVEPNMTTKNLYARPSSGVLSNHFTATPAELSTQTDSTNPAKNLSTGTTIWQIDNSGGGAAITIEFAGTTGNTNPHLAQCFVKTISGTGGSLDIQGTGAVTFSNSTWGRIYTNILSPGATTDKMRITADAGAVIQFTMANMQEHASTSNLNVPTMPIDSAGAQATRAVEFLEATGLGNVLNDAEGTFVFDHVLRAVEPANTTLPILAENLAFTSNNAVTSFISGGNPDYSLSITDNVGATPVATGFYETQVGADFAARLGAAYKSGDTVVYLDGVLKATDAAGFDVDNLAEIGFYRASGSRTATAVLKSFKYYNKRLFNSQIESLTSS